VRSQDREFVRGYFAGLPRNSASASSQFCTGWFEWAAWFFPNHISYARLATISLVTGMPAAGAGCGVGRRADALFAFFSFFAGERLPPAFFATRVFFAMNAPSNAMRDRWLPTYYCEVRGNTAPAHVE
jgi:hypothetical protein